MKALFSVKLNFVIKAVRFPRIGEERNRDDLAKSVNLKSTAAHGTDNGCIMNDLDLNTFLNAPEIKITVSSGTERISDNEEADILSLG